LWFAVGVVAGLLPTLILILIAPRQFLAEAVLFPALGPEQYYTEIGKAWRLGPNRFLRLLIAAAIGPALIATLEVVWRGRRWTSDPVPRVMLAAAVGGIISAALNRPFQIFYLLPALPPLFVLAALTFTEINRRPTWLKAIWALCIAAGLVPVGAWIVHAARAGITPAMDAQRRADLLGAALRQYRVDGSIGTLAGQYVPDAGADIDPRFASGPFLYRMRGFISPAQARDWHVVTRDQLGTMREKPPAAIVTGDYPDVQPAQELQLAEQARALGYKPTARAAGLVIWTRRP
jgi:hypothetical protein